MLKKLPKVILYILICEAVGLFGTVFTIDSIPTWYASLNKPFFSPPNSIFGPVWTTLYALMGVAWYLISSSKAKSKSSALNVFYIQLALNAVWSIIFFGLKSPELALIDIVLMLVFIFLTIKSFYKISKVAAFLLVPYILWVSFATMLNLSIVLLN